MKYLLVVFSFFGFSCSCCDPVPDPVDPPDTQDCGAACSHLRDLGCEEGQPLEDGTTCEQFCVETQDSGHWLRPSCVINITTCSELETVCGEAP